jgi:DNA invertase Pin-like site-specific DNA recombinase
MKKNYVTLCRVSTAVSQGLDGHGMESQRQSVREYVEKQGGLVVGQFEEVVSGSKTDAERPVLKEALELCKKTEATLVCKKLDRLGRNASFLLSLIDSGVDLVFVDQPGICKFSLSILACVASHERMLISSRTKAGLMVAKARGIKLGGSNGGKRVELMNKARKEKTSEFNAKTMEVVKELKESGVRTLRGFSECLNRRGYTTIRGNRWHPKTIRDVLNGVAKAA